MMDISGYSEYYKDISELLGEEYMRTAQVNGVQYGLPSLKDLATEPCVVFRSDAPVSYTHLDVYKRQVLAWSVKPTLRGSPR